MNLKTFQNFVKEDFLNSDDYLNSDDLVKACEIFNRHVKTMAAKHAPFSTHELKGRLEALVTGDELPSMTGRISNSRGTK